MDVYLIFLTISCSALLIGIGVLLALYLWSKNIIKLQQQYIKSNEAHIKRLETFNRLKEKQYESLYSYINWGVNVPPDLEIEEYVKLIKKLKNKEEPK